MTAAPLQEKGVASYLYDTTALNCSAHEVLIQAG